MSVWPVVWSTEWCRHRIRWYTSMITRSHSATEYIGGAVGGGVGATQPVAQRAQPAYSGLSLKVPATSLPPMQWRMLCANPPLSGSRHSTVRYALITTLVHWASVCASTAQNGATSIIMMALLVLRRRDAGPSPRW